MSTETKYKEAYEKLLDLHKRLYNDYADLIAATLPLQQVQKEDIRDNKINLLEEDLAVVHHYLDDLSMPRKNDGGDAYSIVGRIKQLELYYMKKLSEIESEYLQKTEPESKDKPFVWTDELIIEFANDLPVDEIANGQHVYDFKKSKQSPTNLQEKIQEVFDKYYPPSTTVKDKQEQDTNVTTNNDDVPCLSLNEIKSFVGEDMSWYAEQNLIKAVKMKLQSANQ